MPSRYWSSCEGVRRTGHFVIAREEPLYGRQTAVPQTPSSLTHSCAPRHRHPTQRRLTSAHPQNNSKGRPGAPSTHKSSVPINQPKKDRHSSQTIYLNSQPARQTAKSVLSSHEKRGDAGFPQRKKMVNEVCPTASPGGGRENGLSPLLRLHLCHALLALHAARVEAIFPEPTFSFKGEEPRHKLWLRTKRDVRVPTLVTCSAGASQCGAPLKLPSSGCPGHPCSLACLAPPKKAGH